MGLVVVGLRLYKSIETSREYSNQKEKILTNCLERVSLKAVKWLFGTKAWH
jgi:predicted phosphohydrolase